MIAEMMLGSGFAHKVSAQPSRRLAANECGQEALRISLLARAASILARQIGNGDELDAGPGAVPVELVEAIAVMIDRAAYDLSEAIDVLEKASW